MQCPDCRGRLASGAIKCGCGWNAMSGPVHIDCAHIECTHSAIAKIQTPLGWAKVCHKHYVQHYHEKAKERCAEKGLHTPQQCRDWLKKNKLNLKKFAA